MEFKKNIVGASFFILLAAPIYSQDVLNADGPGNTYELINSVLAPGYEAVENPECIHPLFGRHIAEVWDTDLSQYTFEFYSHVALDNDRCINLDRERIEIKTYEQSPDNLKGINGETITYKWKFKLPVVFQPSSSFTHIHQIKAVGGTDDAPLFTLTPRKGSPNKMELIHDNTTKVAIVNLSIFEGVWVECTEIIKVDSIHGTYSMSIKKVSDGSTILSYSNSNIMTIRSDNTFIRPKWGIYRSLINPTDLRDEALRFASFSIAEGVALPVELQSFSAKINRSNVELVWSTATEVNNAGFEIERAVVSGQSSAKAWSRIGFVDGTGTTNAPKNYSFVDASAKGSVSYRLKQIDRDGKFEYSQEVELMMTQIPQMLSLMQNYPNPFNPSTTIGYDIPFTSNVHLAVFDCLGREVDVLVNKTQILGRYQLEWNGVRFPSGIYLCRLQTEQQQISRKIILIK